jgi:hypothetical protein
MEDVKITISGTTKIKILLIRMGGIAISLISLVWMPWAIRIAWAKLVYKLTYVNPAKNPTYMTFIEMTNAKYQMGKRTEGIYSRIQAVKEQHEV